MKLVRQSFQLSPEIARVKHDGGLSEPNALNKHEQSRVVELYEKVQGKNGHHIPNQVGFVVSDRYLREASHWPVVNRVFGDEIHEEIQNHMDSIHELYRPKENALSLELLLSPIRFFPWFF